MQASQRIIREGADACQVAVSALAPSFHGFWPVPSVILVDRSSRICGTQGIEFVIVKTDTAKRLGPLRKCLLVSASILVAIIGLELTLQLIAVVYHRFSATTEHWVSEYRGAPEYRILCLGESTTEGFDEVAYPQLLAEALNQRQAEVPFRVMNAGFVAMHTSDLVDALADLIGSYDPHMVIVMMGINDQFNFHGLTVPGQSERTQILLLRLKLYKLFRIAGSNISDLIQSRANQQHLAIYNKKYEDLYVAWSKWELRDPASEFLGLIQMAREVALPPEESAATTLNIREEYLFNYLNLYLFLQEIYLLSDRLDDAIALYEEAVRQHPSTEFFYRGLAGFHAKAGDSQRSSEYLQIADTLAVEKVLGLTVQNFRRVGQLLDEHGITFVAMQYPMRSVMTLRAVMGNAPGVLYVDNETSFREQVGTLGYETLFVDRFAGDFGHCSETGNRLIVTNLLDQVFNSTFE